MQLDVMIFLPEEHNFKPTDLEASRIHYKKTNELPINPRSTAADQA